MVKLHPKACKSFDDRVDGLRALVQKKSPLREPSRPRDPDVHISAHLTENDIAGPIQIGHVDSLGNPIDRWVGKDKELVGFEGDTYQEFARLCHSLQSTDALRDCVSQRFVEDRVFEWLTDDTARDHKFSSFIQERATEAQRTENYWIPIAHLRTTRPIQIGKVVFRRITKVMIDALELSLREHEEMRHWVDQFILKRRKQVQGYTAGTITITAELSRGRELAFDAVDTALSMLRFFEPGSVDPDQTSFVVPLGQESRGTRISFVLNGDTPANWEESQIVNKSMDSVFDTKFIEDIRLDGLAQVSEMIRKPKQSKYERKLVEALTVYSRVSISPQLSDKLVYALVALESIFLKDSSEPIKKNLGERIAFLIGQDVARRKEIVALTDQIYDIRSRLLHHGKQVPDGETRVKEFLLIAWSALHALIMNADHFTAIEEVLTRLDDRKMA